MFIPTLSFICLAGAAFYIALCWLGRRDHAWPGKVLASTSFVAIAFISNAYTTTYGQLIMAALILSWLGDLLLLSLKKVFLLASIVAFFLAHVAFAIAFYLSGFDTFWFGVSLIVSAVFAFFILRWLSPNLNTIEKIVVPAYVVAISLMVAFAVGASARSLPNAVGFAAVLFAISDISVARDRFVKHENMNKTWGLPLYYIAQLIFAATAIAVVR